MNINEQKEKLVLVFNKYKTMVLESKNFGILKSKLKEILALLSKKWSAMNTKMRMTSVGLTAFAVLLVGISGCSGGNNIEGDKEYQAWLKEKCDDKCIFSAAKKYELANFDGDNGIREKFLEHFEVKAVNRFYKIKNDNKPESEWREFATSEIEVKLLSKPKDTKIVSATLATAHFGSNGVQTYIKTLDFKDKDTVRFFIDRPANMPVALETNFINRGAAIILKEIK